MDLTDDEKFFIQQRLIPKAPRQIYAEYPDLPQDLHLRPHVLYALEQAARSLMRMKEPTKEDVINGFLDAAYLASSSADLIAAWREIGKVQGVYAETKVTHVHEVKTPADIAALPDEELMRLAEIPAEPIDVEFDDLSDDEGRSDPS